MTFKFARKLFQVCSQLLQPKIDETKEILESRGYFISQYNLIMKSPASEYAIGMIRDSSCGASNPERVLVSYSAQNNGMSNQVMEEARGLIKVLNQEGIYYKNLTGMRTNSRYETVPDKFYRIIA
jgi:hypothetical protein